MNVHLDLSPLMQFITELIYRQTSSLLLAPKTPSLGIVETPMNWLFCNSQIIRALLHIPII